MTPDHRIIGGEMVFSLACFDCDRMDIPPTREEAIMQGWDNLVDLMPRDEYNKKWRDDKRRKQHGSDAGGVETELFSWLGNCPDCLEDARIAATEAGSLN